MQDAPVAWIDVISPVVTFVIVIILPIFASLWVIFKTLTEKDEASGDS